MALAALQHTGLPPQPQVRRRVRGAKPVRAHAHAAIPTSLRGGGRGRRGSSEDTSWQLYQLVNRRFAETIARIYQPDDIGALPCPRTLPSRQRTRSPPCFARCS